MKNKRVRLLYTAGFLLLFVSEILIALFVKDAFIRPYGGDILVTVLLCCFVRIFFPEEVRLLPLWVFVFAVFVEFSQMIPLVELIGLGEITFFRVLMGTSFAVLDIVCYGVGCLVFFGLDVLAKKLFIKA